MVYYQPMILRRLPINKKWYRRRKRLLEILEVGNDLDHTSRAYDFLSAFAIVLNLTASIMYTFDSMEARFGSALLWIERITVAFFAIDYILRLFTDFLPVRSRRLPYDSYRAYFPAVPHQRLLRFPACYYGGYLR